MADRLDKLLEMLEDILKRGKAFNDYLNNRLDINKQLEEEYMREMENELIKIGKS